MKEEEKEITLKVPMDLYERLRAAGEKSGLGSPEDMLLHMAWEVFGDKAAEMDKAELEQVHQRLRDLGYM